MCGLQMNESYQPILKNLGLLVLFSLYIYEINDINPSNRRNPHGLVLYDIL